MVAHSLILLTFAATPVFSFFWFNGPDIPIDVNNIDVDEPTPESGEEAPGEEGEEGVQSNQDRFNWWQEQAPESSAGSPGAGEGAALPGQDPGFHWWQQLTPESAGEEAAQPNQESEFSWWQHLTPESEGEPGGEEAALPDPGYSFFQQWVTGHGSPGDEDDSRVTGNGTSPHPGPDSSEDKDDSRVTGNNATYLPGPDSSEDEDDSRITGNNATSLPGQDSPGDEDDDRVNIPSGGGDYCALDASHTMCKFKGPSPSCASKTKSTGMTQAAKDAVLAKHNDLRRKVAKGEEANQPRASNMRELVWDDELAAIAQRWADQCTFAHSRDVLLDGTMVGQSIATAGNSQQLSEDELLKEDVKAVQAWYDEVKLFSYSSTFSFSSATGHYTQLVWAETDRLGCGTVYYLNGMLSNSIVCNYAVAGNMRGASIYSQGPACSACPSSTTCVDSLCRRAAEESSTR